MLWSDDDDLLMRTEYGKTPTQELSMLLGRSIAAIRHRARVLKLSTPWSVRKDGVRCGGTYRIPLGDSGEFAVVSASRYQLVREYSWHLEVTASGQKYARARVGSKIVRMHKHLSTATRVRHLDGDGLNNTDANIR